MIIDKSIRIRAVGKSAGIVDAKKRPVCEVHCQGCGDRISSEEDLSEVEYVKTKRGSEFFFHAACRDKVWQHGIC